MNDIKNNNNDNNNKIIIIVVVIQIGKCIILKNSGFIVEI